MISYQLFAVSLLLTEQETMEISAEDICYDGFTFRLSKVDRDKLENGSVESCSVTFRNLQDSTQLKLNGFVLQREADGYRLTTEDLAYQRRAKQLILEIQEYTRRKNMGDDAALSAFYTGYPAEKENAYADSYCSWRSKKFSNLQPDETWMEQFRKLPEVILCLSTPEKAEDYLNRGIRDTWRKELKAAGLDQHPMRERIPEGVAFGNLYCPHLLPEESLLQGILERCEQDGMRPMLMLPPMTEDRIEKTKRLLICISSQRRQCPWQLMLGDTGTAQMIRELLPEQPGMIAGPLLARGRKDPRFMWWTGNKEQLRDTSSGSRLLRDWYGEFGIQAMCWESCGYLPAIEPGDCLLAPFYQLNTATLCTMKAVCEQGERGSQTMDMECPRWCREQAFLYGDHLNMVGRGNTLFGLDTEVLQNSEILRQLRQAGLKQMMIELL